MIPASHKEMAKSFYELFVCVMCGITGRTSQLPQFRAVNKAGLKEHVPDVGFHGAYA